MLTVKTCLDCGGEYRGGPKGRYCRACRIRRVSESAKRRRLCEIGASARWGTKKEEEENAG